MDSEERFDALVMTQANKTVPQAISN